MKNSISKFIRDEDKENISDNNLNSKQMLHKSIDTQTETQQDKNSLNSFSADKDK